MISMVAESAINKVAALSAPENIQYFYIVLKQVNGYWRRTEKFEIGAGLWGRSRRQKGGSQT